MENFEPRGRLERRACFGTWYRSAEIWLSTMIIVAAAVGCRRGALSLDAGSAGSAGAAATATGGVGGNRGIGTGGIGTTGTGGTVGTAGTGGGSGAGDGGGGGGGSGIGGSAGLGGGGSGTSGIGGASVQGGSARTNAGGNAGSAGSAVGGRGGSGTAGGPAGGREGSGGALATGGGAGPLDAGNGDSAATNVDAGALPPIRDARDTDAAICIELAQLKLGTPIWTVNENGTFVERAPVAGGQSRLVIPLSNPTPSMTSTSPGVELTSTTPGVSGTGRFELFGIWANRTESLIWLIKFDNPLVPGSVVHFQGDLFGQDMGRVRCEDSPSLSFDVTLN